MLRLSNNTILADGHLLTWELGDKQAEKDATLAATNYDALEARQFLQDHGRLPTTREAITKTVKHPDTRTREQKTVIQTPQQKSEEEFIQEQIAFLQQNPGTDKADRASKKKELKRWEDRLKLLHKKQEAENEKTEIALAEIKINPVTQEDLGRRLHANQLLERISMCEEASVQDVEFVVSLTQMRGSQFDNALSTWRTDFLSRIKRQTMPQPTDTVQRANELLEQRNRIKSMVEMPESKTPVKEVEKIDRVQLPPGMKF